jgi:activator of HSP90 ATPase
MAAITKAIQQSVQFNAPAEELFEMYLDSKKHSAAPGGRARISRKVGGAFTAWEGELKGKNPVILPRKMIVQSWRAIHWQASDLNSMMLRFSYAAGGGQVDIVHPGVPEHDHKGMSEGRPKYYWEPWK